MLVPTHPWTFSFKYRINLGLIIFATDVGAIGDSGNIARDSKRARKGFRPLGEKAELDALAVALAASKE